MFTRREKKVFFAGLAMVLLVAAATNLGPIVSKNIGTIRFADLYPGVDIGDKINAANVDKGPCGIVVIVKASYSFSTPINEQQATCDTILGLGGLTSGSLAASVLTWTGTTTPILAQSSTSIRLLNLQFRWSNALFAGPYIAAGHTGTGCGGGGCDTSKFELGWDSFFATGAGVNIPLVDLDKNIGCSVHDSSFHNFATYAIRGATNSASYANVCEIARNFANTATGDSSGFFLLNPGQSFSTRNNILELGDAVGVVGFVGTTAGTVTSAFLSQNDWAGDAHTTQTYIFADFSLSTSIGAIEFNTDFIFLTATSTYVKTGNSATLTFVSNTVGNCTQLFNLGGAGNKVDLGEGNNFSGTCATFYGANNPSDGYAIASNGHPLMFGNPVQAQTRLAVLGAGTAAAPAYGMNSVATGFFANSNGRIQTTSGGTVGTALDNQIMTFPSGLTLGWSNAADPNAGGTDLGLSRISANLLGIGTGAQGNSGGGLKLANMQLTSLLLSSTAPTISSGFGTTPTVPNNNGAAAFTINVGTGGTATSGVIGLPTAANGWVCKVDDLTTQSATVFFTHQIASTTTTATIANFNTAGAQAAWAASDILSISCLAR